MNILIAAATSNSGKTTITMGLLRALRNRGLKVQPYKCGPDYIDTMFHELASGRTSVNLDTFMQSEEHVQKLFRRYGADADCRIVEGVMGMYDGYDRWHGSSAEIAHLLDIPTLLVVNAKSAAYSVAPLIYGFKHFRVHPLCEKHHSHPLYVIFNQVASETHYAHLKAACEDAGAVCLGYMPRNADLVIPGRHLGLTITAQQETERLIALAARELEAHADLDMLLDSASADVPCADTVSIPCAGAANDDMHWNKDILTKLFGISDSSRQSVVAVADDEAFNFTYRANIDALHAAATVRFFSPLHDDALPECDALYLPGGYPELFAEELSSNGNMRESIRQFAEAGGRVFAECGGFMYLCRDIDGTPMAGVLPFSATMQGARLHLGYRQLSGNSPFHPLRGHEFHYSSVIVPDPLPDGITAECSQLTAKKDRLLPTAIYHYKNVTAGYTHWYWASLNS